MSIALTKNAVLKCRRVQPIDRFVGGADRDRTDDPLLAKQVLSQTELQPQKLRNASAPGAFGGSGWIRTIDPRLIKTVL